MLVIIKESKVLFTQDLTKITACILPYCQVIKPAYCDRDKLYGNAAKQAVMFLRKLHHRGMNTSLQHLHFFLLPMCFLSCSSAPDIILLLLLFR